MVIKRFPFGNSGVMGLTLQSDGKIIGAGYRTFGPSFALVRWRADGTEDPSFGEGGVVIGDFGYTTLARDVAVQADGKIVAAGDMLPEGAHDPVFAVGRFLPNGSPDPAFGNAGRVTLDIGGTGNVGTAVAVQSDGKILVAGSAYEMGADYYVTSAVVFRLLADGRVDTEFGNGGQLLVPGGIFDDVMVQSDGKILLAGFRYNFDYVSRLLLVRCNAGGTLDTDFGEGGIARDGTTAGNMAASALALQNDGRIVTAGYFQAGKYPEDDGALLITRWLANGEPDSAFNGTGVMIVDPRPPGAGNAIYSPEFASAVVVQPDGKIITAGSGRSQFCLMRHHPDGRLDTAFDEDGMVFNTSGDDVSAAADALLLPDGRIVTGGGLDGDQDAIALVCYRGRDDTATLTLEHPAGEHLKTDAVVEFGPVVRGDSLPRQAPMTLRNAGGAVLTGLRTEIKGTGAAQFSVDSSPGSLGIGESADLTVSFQPLAVVSDFEATLLIRGDAPDGCLVRVKLHGATMLPGAALEVYNDGVLLPLSSELKFGPVMVEQGASTKTLSLTNAGNIALTIQSVSFLPAGTPGDFSVTAPETMVLEANASVPVNVTFSPTAEGERKATLRIFSSDTFEPAYDIILSGHIATPLELWRFQHFGVYGSEDAAADTADPDGDGTPNLIEYATLTDPLAGNPPPGQLVKNGGTLEYTVTRSAASAAEFIWAVEWNDAPDSEGWNAMASPAVILSDDGARQVVRFSLPAGERGKRFVRVRVSGK
jgi:uncharacterized delta-60 repeat protein